MVAVLRMVWGIASGLEKESRGRVWGVLHCRRIKVGFRFSGTRISVILILVLGKDDAIGETLALAEDFYMFLNQKIEL